jgi:NTP pyrophosphatase (non-canonical NTP hydrolase)
MDLDLYQSQAVTTHLVRDNTFARFMCLALGVAGESGELVEKIKKVYRDCGGLDAIITTEVQESLKKEIGDVLWYLSVLANDLGLSMSDVANCNLEKLKQRKSKNKLTGSGDNR